MIENAARMGAFFLERLEDLRNNTIKEIRGRGLMIAVEFHEEAGGARRHCEALKDRGLLCKETHQDTIRFAPPLVITREQVDWTLERFGKVLTEMG